MPTYFSSYSEIAEWISTFPSSLFRCIFFFVCFVFLFFGTLSTVKREPSGSIILNRRRQTSQLTADISQTGQFAPKQSWRIKISTGQKKNPYILSFWRGEMTCVFKTKLFPPDLLNIKRTFHKQCKSRHLLTLNTWFVLRALDQLVQIGHIINMNKNNHKTHAAPS